MNLQDISTLGTELKQSFLQNTSWPELTFNRTDKEKIEDIPGVTSVDLHSVKFLLDNGNVIFIPSQYISIAVKIKPFALQLKKYADCFDNLKNINDRNDLVDFIKNNSELPNSEGLSEEDQELFRKMFSSEDISLNFGAKSIINGTHPNYSLRSSSDFFGSVVLKLINVPDNSSGKLGSLIYSLAARPEIYNYLESRFSDVIEFELNADSGENLEENGHYYNKNVIFFGAPGTGKSHKIKEIMTNVPENNFERITFHPEYDYTSFIGGYKPVSVYNEDLDKNEIIYSFEPEVFINIYVNAWHSPQTHFYLIIEEINRGNCAEIFGDVFQLLDRNPEYRISPSKNLHVYLTEKMQVDNEGFRNGKMAMPPNLTILATMNTSDQSLFPMDSAFKRRWDWEYVPIITPSDVNDTSSDSYAFVVMIDGNSGFKWIDFMKEINKHISDPYIGMDKCLGNYFIKPDTDNIITLQSFIHKVIFYLWNDVFKDEDNEIFKDITYQSFFPLATAGIDEIKKILELLTVEVTDFDRPVQADLQLEQEATE